LKLAPRAAPGQKAGPVFFARAKNLPVPAQAPLLAGAPLRRKALLQGRDEERAFQAEQGTDFQDQRQAGKNDPL